MAVSREEVGEIRQDARRQEAAAQALRQTPAATLAVAIDNKESVLGKEIQAVLDNNKELRLKLAELKGKHKTVGEALMAIAELPEEERNKQIAKWKEFSDALEAVKPEGAEKDAEKGKTTLSVMDKIKRKNKIVSMTVDAMRGDSPEAKAARAKFEAMVKDSKELQAAGATMGDEAAVQLALENEEFRTLANKAIDAKQAVAQGADASGPSAPLATPARPQQANARGPRTPAGSGSMSA